MILSIEKALKLKPEALRKILDLLTEFRKQTGENPYGGFIARWDKDVTEQFELFGVKFIPESSMMPGSILIVNKKDWDLIDYYERTAKRKPTKVS